MSYYLFLISRDKDFWQSVRSSNFSNPLLLFLPFNQTSFYHIPKSFFLILPGKYFYLLFHFQASATKGEGLDESMEWLSDTLQNKK